MRRTVGNKKRGRGPRRRPRRAQFMESSMVYTLVLKTNHKKVEVYPIPIAKLFNEASIGSDSDIYLTGYDLQFNIAGGNNMDTVQANIAHAGPWVRTAIGADKYNQQAILKAFSKDGKVAFHKKRLPPSERNYKSPHYDPLNTIDVKIVDAAGVVPGYAVIVRARLFFTRLRIPTAVDGADQVAIDLYADQDIHSVPGGGTNPAPTKLADIPLEMSLYNGDQSMTWVTSDVASPFVYINPRSPAQKLRVTVADTPNIVGRHLISGTFPLNQSDQKKYNDDGFEGTLESFQ